MEKEKGRRELFITVALSILSYYCGEQKLVGWILKKLACENPLVAFQIIISYLLAFFKWH